MKKYFWALTVFLTSSAHALRPNFTPLLPLSKAAVAGFKNEILWLQNGKVEAHGIDSSGRLTTRSLYLNLRDNDSTVRILAGNPSYGEQFCVLQEKNVTCAGADLSAAYIPELVHPRQLVAGSRHVCALDDKGVSCWGNNDWGQINVPSTLVNPQELSVGENHSCVIDQGQVLCWGEGDTRFLPTHLNHPRQMASAKDRSCVLDEDGLHCWSKRSASTLMRSFGQPKTFSMSTQYVCGTFDEGVRCSNFFENDSFSFIGARSVKMVGDKICYTDSENLKCVSRFDSLLEIPAEIKNSTEFHSLSLGDYACGILGARVKCWGDRVPESIAHLENVSEVSWVSTNICVIAGGELKCSGEGGPFDLNPLIARWNLHHPRLLKGARDVQVPLCVVSDEGVHCSQEVLSNVDQIPAQIRNPELLEVGRGFACAVENRVLSCWGRDVRVPADIQNPRQLKVSDDDSICVLHDAGLKCWNSFAGLTPENLGEVDEFNVGGDNACVIELGTLRCWLRRRFAIVNAPGRFLDDEPDENPAGVKILRTPQGLKHPHDLRMMANSACVSHDAGLYCWNFLDFERPMPKAAYLGVDLTEWNLLFNVEFTLSQLAKNLYLHKANFALDVNKLFFKMAYLNPSHFESRLFSLLALRPFIEDLSSDLNRVSAEHYAEALQYYRNVNGVSNLSDFAKNNSNVKLALQINVSALKASKAYIVSSDDQVKIDQLISLGGQVLSEPLRRAEFVRLYTDNVEVLNRARNTWEIKGLIETADKLVEFLR